MIPVLSIAHALPTNSNRLNTQCSTLRAAALCVAHNSAWQAGHQARCLGRLQLLFGMSCS